MTDDSKEFVTIEGWPHTNGNDWCGDFYPKNKFSLVEQNQAEFNNNWMPIIAALCALVVFGIIILVPFFLFLLKLWWKY